MMYNCCQVKAKVGTKVSGPSMTIQGSHAFGSQEFQRSNNTYLEEKKGFSQEKQTIYIIQASQEETDIVD